MNPVTMMFFVVCISGIILLVAPSNDAFYCDPESSSKLYDLLCQLEADGTMPRLANVHRASTTERTTKVASPTTTDKNDKPDSPVAPPQEPPSSRGFRKKDAVQSTDDLSSLDSSVEGPIERVMVGGRQRRRRSIRQKRDRHYNDPSRQCCYLGCTLEDMYARFCPYGPYSRYLVYGSWRNRFPY